MFILHEKPTSKVGGSSFSGLIIDEDVDAILDKLGKPTEINKDKTQLEWQFSDGEKIITIYDYKENKPIYQIHTWHIGSKNVSNDEIKEFFHKNASIL